MKTTLGTFLAIFSFLLSATLFSTHAHAAAYGVQSLGKPTMLKRYLRRCLIRKKHLLT